MTTRREVLAAGLSASALAALGLPALGAYPPPEQTSVKVGLSVSAMSFLPVYVAYARTWKAQGLDVQLLQFRGDAESAQALAGGSIDVMVGSLNGLINMINANQPVMGFYSGFHEADFSFIARPDIKRWSDMKGKSMGISTYGSLTDALTRYALRRNKLGVPEKASSRSSEFWNDPEHLRARDQGRVPPPLGGGHPRRRSVGKPRTKG